MNNIYCENPSVIWHPHAAQLLAKYRRFSMPSGVYTASVAHVNKNHVTKDNIDKYQIINPDTGETFPMFLLVPCNKCKLCNEKTRAKTIDYILKKTEGKTLIFVTHEEKEAVWLKADRTVDILTKH